MALLINNATPAGTDAPSTIDDIIRAFKTAVQDIFGLPDNTTISAAVMSVDSGGLQYIAFTDETADAAAAGRLQRNGAALTFHDGTAARTLVNTATAQTLTTKTLTSPIVGTQITLDQSTADYTLTWADPSAGRAISIPDPGGTDVFVFRDMTQTLINKTLTAPVLGGSITGTYTLAGTPTITSPAISGPTLSGTVAGTPTWASTQTLPALTISGNGAITPAAVSGTPAQHALYRENVVKAWGAIDATPAITDSFNLTSVADGGDGQVTITFDRDFAGTAYVAVGSSTGTGNIVSFTNYAAGSVLGVIANDAGVVGDAPLNFIAIGDQ